MRGRGDAEALDAVDVEMMKRRVGQIRERLVAAHPRAARDPELAAMLRSLDDEIAAVEGVVNAEREKAVAAAAVGNELAWPMHDWPVAEQTVGGLVMAAEGCGDNDDLIAVVTEEGRRVQLLGVTDRNGAVHIVVRI